MAIESRFRTRGGYSHVAPYNRPGRGVLHRKPPVAPAARGRAGAASYAYVAAQQSAIHGKGAPQPAQVGQQHLPPLQPQFNATKCGPYQAPPMNSPDASMAYVAMPMTLPPPICNQTRLPQFDRLYEEFEKMKRGGFVIQPQQQPPIAMDLPGVAQQQHQHQQQQAPSLARIPSPTPSVGSSASSSGEQQQEHGMFAAAMKLFMHSYLPTACFDCATPVDDWGREAQALLSEVMAPGQADERSAKSSWPSAPSSRNTSSDCDVSISGPSSPDKACSGVGFHPAPWVAGARLGEQPRMDIHRHILEIKPSPYPGGSPLSLPSVVSSHSSDNDADDESVASSTSSPASAVPRATGNTTVRRPSHKKKHDSARIRLSMDSGYQSSSTDGGSSCHGSQAPAGCIDSDGFSSDIGSTCSSRPPSPLRGPDAGFLSPTDVPPYLHALLEAPWVQRSGALPPKYPHSVPARGAPIPVVGNAGPTSVAPGSADAAAGNAYTYHKHKDWITDEILEMIVVRDRLYKRMKKHPAPDIVDMYKKVRNMVVGMTRNAKRAHEKKLEDEAARAGAPIYYNSSGTSRPRPRRSSSGYHRAR